MRLAPWGLAVLRGGGVPRRGGWGEKLETERADRGGASHTDREETVGGG